MSAIFKTRKVPKHLIIQDEPRRRLRFSLVKAMLWLVVLVALTGVALMLADYTIGLG